VSERVIDRFSTYVGLGQTDAFEMIYWASVTEWVEVGYENILRAIGHPMGEILKGDWDTPVVNVNIEYRRPLRLGQEITVETEVVAVGNRSFRTETRVLAADGEVSVRVARTMVATLRKGGAASLPDWIKVLGPPRQKPEGAS
jgi:YbgC/YbaW family acyl-CoA thioester hydrolase